MDEHSVPALVGESARLAHLSEKTIRKMVDAGTLPAVRTESGVRLIDRAAVEALARERAARRSAGGARRA